MTLLTPTFLLYIIGIATTLLTLVFVWFQTKYRYWNDRGITHTSPKFPFGDAQGIKTKRNIDAILKDIYQLFPDEKLVGFWLLSAPFVLVRDPGIIKNLLVKDFTTFHDRGFEIDTDLEPFIGNLFGLKGQEWRNMRVKLTPTFTSGKMKMMFPTASAVGETLVKVLNKEVDKGGVVEVKEYLARYTTDVIASTAFGLEINCLENPDNEFRKKTKAVIRPEGFRSLITGFLLLAMPKIFTLFRIRLLPEDVSSFFIAAVDDTIKTREKQNIHRNDFMQLLIQIKNKGYLDDVDADRGTKTEPTQEQKFTIVNAAAQAFIFFIAGLESSSNTMQFALYELALQPDLQRELQVEMDKVTAKHGGKLTYEGMLEMELLDRVVAETLRKYPVGGPIVRGISSDYSVPESNITLKKGEQVFISVLGLHHDPKYYPNPEKFDPNRFLPEEKEKRNHYAYLPFGEGPRACIGNRFGLMQTKIGLIVILSAFNVEVCEKTPIPVVLDPSQDFMTPVGGMHLKLKQRQ